MGTTEEWKTIKGFNLYEVSNFGNIRSKSRITRNCNGTFKMSGKLLRPQPNNHGYLRVQLKQYGRSKRSFVHRLVAEAFIENPLGKKYVNHRDNNPTNNMVNNLEWVTHQENMDWMNKQGRAKRTEKWIEHLHKSQESTYTPVTGINVETGEKIKFAKLNDVASRGFQPSCVSNCCKGKRDKHKGYRWLYG